MFNRKRYRAGMIGLVVGGLTLGVLACDTTVTNPGPVQDEFLSEPAAQPALVDGSGRAMAEAMNWLGYTAAAVAREIHPSGSTGSFGITVRWQRGELGGLDGDLDTHWENAQRARWLAEEAVRKIQDAGPVNDNVLPGAMLWAGFANRLMGEMYCEVTIDGGPPQGNDVALDRALEWFNQVASQATGDRRLAAIGGRASVHAFQGNWAEAAADAAQVPTGFSWQIPYFDLGDDDQKNRIQWSSAAQPYKAHTTWNTWHFDYAAATGDPRVQMDITNEVGDAAIDCCGTVPWHPQLKHPTSDSNIDLVTGTQMRLIEAEAALNAGNMAAGLGFINQARAAAGLAPATPATMADTWSLLKREWGIETWLEGRRLAQFRRWAAAGTPGALHPLETVDPTPADLEGSHLAQQDLCFPIPPTEQDTNENVPKASG